MRRYRQNTAPRRITARYASTCAETGAAIKPGDTAIYIDGKTYCDASKTAEQFRANEFAAAFNMADANY